MKRKLLSKLNLIDYILIGFYTLFVVQPIIYGIIILIHNL